MQKNCCFRYLQLFEVRGLALAVAGRFTRSLVSNGLAVVLARLPRSSISLCFTQTDNISHKMAETLTIHCGEYSL